MAIVLKYSSQLIKNFIGAVVVYDCTEPDSFKKMGQWVAELQNYLPSGIPILIAGNKTDLYNNK